MDILIYICGTLVLFGSLWLGYLGVFGHMRSNKILALWVFYSTIVFGLAVLFLQITKKFQSEEQPQSLNYQTAEILPINFHLLRLEANACIAIEVALRNRGDEGTDLQGVSKVFITDADTFPDDYTGTKPLAIHIPKRATSKVVFISAQQPTKKDLKAIDKEKLSIVLWARFTYSSSEGEKPLPICSSYVAPLKGFYNCGRVPKDESQTT